MKFPDFIKIRYVHNENSDKLGKILEESSINTVCVHARCPNKFECFSKNHLTFMILGKYCTRNCTFCSVAKLPPENIDQNEPMKIAGIVSRLNLKHAVVTSVTRDDLDDFGSGQFIEVIKCIRNMCDVLVKIEILVPDFLGRSEIIDKFKYNPPDIFAHNIETIPRLYPVIRPMANFERSLKVLNYAAGLGFSTKSGFMVGLGEEKHEIVELLKTLKNVGVSIVTIGQYLKPKGASYEIQRFVEPAEFDEYKDIALNIGFKEVKSGTFVRSSYIF